MKKIILLTLITLNLLFLFSCKKVDTNYISNAIAIVYQDETPYLINAEKETYSLERYDEVLDDFSDYIIVKKDNLYGIIKNTGEEVCEPKFDKIYQIRESKAVAIVNNEYYIIDPNGNILYTFSDNVKSTSYFSENHLVVFKDNLYGYLTYNEKLNEFTLLDLTYNLAYPYTNDYAVVARLDYYNVYEETDEGINQDNIIETVYLDNYKYNYVDLNNNLLFDFEFDFADNFYDEWARVGVKKTSKYYVYGTQRTKDIDTMVYSYISSNGTYLTYYYYINFLAYVTVSTPIETQWGTYYKNTSEARTYKIRRNDKIEVPYAQNFHDGYAVIGNLYLNEKDPDLYYKAFMIVNQLGEMDYYDAIFHQTNYYCGYEEVTDSLNSVEVYQPVASKFYYVEVAKIGDTIIFRNAATFTSNIWSFYYNTLNYSTEDNQVTIENSFQKISINPFNPTSEVKEISSWLKNYVENNYPDATDELGVSISLSEISSPYEADPIHTSSFISESEVSRVRIIKENTYGLIGFRYSTKHNDAYDVDIPFVESYFIIDPIYDKIVY